MRKLVLTFLAFLCFSTAVFADEEYTYNLMTDSDYTLFCPKKIYGMNMRSSGNISFESYTDVMNSQSTFSISTSSDNAGAIITLETDEGTVKYRLNVDKENKEEKFDENFYKIDKPPIIKPPKQEPEEQTGAAEL